MGKDLETVLEHLGILLVHRVLAESHEKWNDSFELAAQAVTDRTRDARNRLDICADFVGGLGRLDVVKNGAYQIGKELLRRADSQ